MPVKLLLLVMLGCIAWAFAAHAGAPGYVQATRPLIYFDPGDPAFLPRRFRNHCRFDVTFGRFYCSDHCGSDYQIYYCSRGSFGCCHIGVGYCDSYGLLRCRP
jgi:hypothetical protein